jgi:integrase
MKATPENIQRYGSHVVEVTKNGKTLRATPVQNNGYLYWQFAISGRSADGKIDGKRRFITAPNPEAAKAKLSIALTTKIRVAETVKNITQKEASEYGEICEILRPTQQPPLFIVKLVADMINRIGSWDRLVSAVDHYEKMFPTTLPSVTMPEAAEKYLKHQKKQGASERYLDDITSRVGFLVADHGGQVSGISGAELSKWIEARDVGQQTKQNIYRIVRTFFQYCKTQGWVTVNPLADQPMPKILRKKEVDPFKPDELERILRAASPEFSHIIALQAFAGLRTAEVTRLHWGDIRFDENQIVVSLTKSKTKNRRFVPIQPNLAAWLKFHKHHHPNSLIWTDTASNLYNQQRFTAMRTGMIDSGGTVVPPVRWKNNGLRHGFGTARYAVTRDDVRVSAEMGNSVRVLHQHYAALASESEGKAWFSIMPARREEPNEPVLQ